MNDKAQDIANNMLHGIQAGVKAARENITGGELVLLCTLDDVPAVPALTVFGIDQWNEIVELYVEDDVKFASSVVVEGKMYAGARFATRDCYADRATAAAMIGVDNGN